jgi:hypothetical protein
MLAAALGSWLAAALQAASPSKAMVTRPIPIDVRTDDLLDAPGFVTMMDQPAGSRSSLALLWLAGDPAKASARLRLALGEQVDPRVAYSLGGLALTVTTSTDGDRFDRLQVVDRDAGPRVELGAIVAVGWATVDLDRASDQLLASGVVSGRPITGVPIPALGASACRVNDSAFGVPLVLLEPTAEGRLAATLARVDEGPCALFVGAPGAGPAGLLPGGPPTGPHLLVHGDGYHRPR